ncbi:hypothetical protein ACRYCC_42920 [Actinomadura scrupuli]
MSTEQGHPGLGDRHTGGGPDEQFDAELAFQRADRPSNRHDRAVDEAGPV